MKSIGSHNLRFTILDLRFVINKKIPQKKIDKTTVNTFNLKFEI